MISKILAIIDGSWCPHYKCGGSAHAIWIDGHKVNESSNIIEYCSSSYQAECYAMLSVTEYLVTKPELSDDYGFLRLKIITDNQNLAARMIKENNHNMQINYHRPKPLDRLFQLALANETRLIYEPFWKKFVADSPERLIHKAAYSQMLEARKLILQKHTPNK